MRARARTRQAHAYSVKSSNQKKKIHEKRESPLNRLAISRCFFREYDFSFCLLIVFYLFPSKMRRSCLLSLRAHERVCINVGLVGIYGVSVGKLTGLLYKFGGRVGKLFKNTMLKWIYNKTGILFAFNLSRLLFVCYIKHRRK